MNYNYYSDYEPTPPGLNAQNYESDYEPTPPGLNAQNYDSDYEPTPPGLNAQNYDSDYEPRPSRSRGRGDNSIYEQKIYNSNDEEYEEEEYEAGYGDVEDYPDGEPGEDSVQSQSVNVDEYEDEIYQTIFQTESATAQYEIQVMLLIRGNKS